VRDVVLTFKVSEAEAAEIRKAGKGKVGEYIRERVLGIARPSDGIPVNPVADVVVKDNVITDESEGIPLAAETPEVSDYNRLVQRNHKRMGLKAAESLARRELDA